MSTQNDFDFEEHKDEEAKAPSAAPSNRDETLMFRPKSKPPPAATRPGGSTFYKDEPRSDARSTYSGRKETAHSGRREQPGFSPEAIHYNYFYVGVSGSIESGEFPHLDGLNCKFTLLCGKDWQLADVPLLVL